MSFLKINQLSIIWLILSTINGAFVYASDFDNSCTVFYCDVHDQGFVILGNHMSSYGSEFKSFSCGPKPHLACAIENYGMLTQSDGKLDSSDCIAVSIDYARKNGGWHLKYYRKEAYTAKGDEVKLPPLFKSYFTRI